MIKRQLLDEIGTLDEGFFMLFEEVDWCFGAKKAGWEIWFTPRAQVVHHHGNRWWLDGIAYSGLMALACVRIAAYRLRAMVS